MSQGNLKNINKTKKDFVNTKGKLYDTLDNKLSNLEATKSELERYKQALIERGITDEFEIAEYLQDYPINKKLQFVLHEMSLHDQLDAAIEFLDEVILRDDESVKGKKD